MHGSENFSLSFSLTYAFFDSDVTHDAVWRLPFFAIWALGGCQHTHYAIGIVMHRDEWFRMYMFANGYASIGVINGHVIRVMLGWGIYLMCPSLGYVWCVTPCLPTSAFTEFMLSVIFACMHVRRGSGRDALLKLPDWGDALLGVPRGVSPGLLLRLTFAWTNPRLLFMCIHNYECDTSCLTRLCWFTHRAKTFLGHFGLCRFKQTKSHVYCVAWAQAF